MKGIYSIKNNITGRIYIGSSNDILKRIKQHFNNLRKNKHPNKLLQNSFNKHLESCFTYEILQICNENITQDEILQIEQFYINKHDFNKLYNSIGSDGRL